MFSLHHPNAREIFSIRADQPVVKSTIGVIRAIDALRQASAPEVIVTIARKQFPGLPDIEAVAELQLSIEKAVSEMSVFKMLAQKAVKAEEIRMAPTTNRVMTRIFEITGKVPRLKISIASAAHDAEKKVESLTKLGVSPEEAARVTGDYGEAADRAELEEISAELLKLETFTRTWNEADLPAGFALPAVAPVQESGRGA